MDNNNRNGQSRTDVLGFYALMLSLFFVIAMAFFHLFEKATLFTISSAIALFLYTKRKKAVRKKRLAYYLFLASTAISFICIAHSVGTANGSLSLFLGYVLAFGLFVVFCMIIDCFRDE